MGSEMMYGKGLTNTWKHGFTAGDLVKMKQGYSEAGILIEVLLPPSGSEAVKWARIFWPDYGLGIEKIRDLRVVS